MVFTEEPQVVHLPYLCRRFDLTIITTNKNRKDDRDRKHRKENLRGIRGTV